MGVIWVLQGVVAGGVIWVLLYFWTCRLTHFFWDTKKQTSKNSLAGLTIIKPHLNGRLELKQVQNVMFWLKKSFPILILEQVVSRICKSNALLRQLF